MLCNTISPQGAELRPLLLSPSVNRENLCQAKKERVLREATSDRADLLVEMLVQSCLELNHLIEEAAGFSHRLFIV